MINRDAPQVALDAPIPGQGLTAPLGGRPWQRPAEFSTAEEALAFYVEKITDKRTSQKMFDLLQLGLPVDKLVDTMQLGGVMEGLHSVDVGMIIAPALHEVITGMADKVGVEYVSMATVDEEAPTESQVAVVMDELRSEDDTLSVEEDKPKEEVSEEEAEKVVRGLMARKK
jgi:hypothetical protein